MASWAGGALIASPNSTLREQVLHSLNGRCQPVHQAWGGAEALVQLEKGNWQVLFLDRRLPDLDAEELTATIQRRFPGIRVVLLDSDSTHLSEKDMAAGPGDTVNFEAEWLPEDSHKYLPEPVESESLPGMIGRSEGMQRVYRLARLVASRTTTVLISGATGSGKELVARALHELSPRAAKPFIVVNCAAVPEALIESELFGHARGAFTGAVQPQLGRIPAAQGGTLFLDEISEMPLSMQAKLLRFLEHKEVQRLGASEVIRVDVRVIAASNANLGACVERGEFREDLFYRLMAFPLEMPGLADRRADIVPLAEYFLTSIAAAMTARCPVLSAGAVRLLEGHAWKGNVRELQHVMERASILLEGADTVLAEHLYFPFMENGGRQTWPEPKAVATDAPRQRG
jgi:DNA-binding NtrC family response regulator